MRRCSGPDVSIAAVNGPSLCVASGTFEAIEALEAVLAARNVSARRLHTSHAFHSAMMDPVLPALQARVAEVRLIPPALPLGLRRNRRVGSPTERPPARRAWARHCREPVRFADALATLTADSAPVLLEVGPGRALTTLALQGSGRGLVVVNSLADATRAQDDLICLNEAVGRLWCAGVSPDWQALHAPFDRRRVSLPTYRFQRERCWIDAPVPAQKPATLDAPLAAPLATTSATPLATPLATHDAPVAPQPSSPAPSEPEAIIMTTNDQQASGAMRAAKLRERITAILEALSGETLSAADADTSFSGAWI